MVRKFLKKSSNSLVCATLILVAPLLAAVPACMLFWGEPELPECLKNEE